MVPAETAQTILGLRRFASVVTALPETEKGGKIGSGVLELGMRLIRLRLFIGRPLPRVLDAEGGGDDDDLRETSLLAGLDNHPGNPRIKRKLRHDPPPFRQAVGRGGTAT